MARLRALVLLIPLIGAGCHRTSEKDTTAATAELQAQIASQEAILNDHERAQRWVYEQTQWRRLKNKRFAEFTAARESTLHQVISSPTPEQMGRIEELVKLHNRGAYGFPGAIPPFLDLVSDSADSTIVRNKTNYALMIRVSRIFAPGQRDLETHCPMYGDRQRSQYNGAVQVAAGEAHTFINSQVPNCQRIGEAALEFEVLDGDEWMWATETAMEEELGAPGGSFKDVARQYATRAPPSSSPALDCSTAESSKATVESILSCAQERGLPTGPTWALISQWHDNGNLQRRASGRCMQFTADGQRKLAGRFEVAHYMDQQVYWAAAAGTAKTLEETAARACGRYTRQ